MKKKIYLTCFIVFITIQQTLSINPPIEETLLSKVSFFYFQDSTDVFFKYTEIVDRFNKKVYNDALKKSLLFIETYSKSVQKDEEINYLFEVNLIIGDIYRNINNHSKSILYYRNAIGILKKQHIKLETNSLKGEANLESTYLKLANEFLRDSKRDSAKKYYNLILNSNSFNDKLQSLQANASSNLSGLYRQDSLYDLAKEYALKALKIHKRNNNTISQASSLGNLASIYLDQNNFKEAKKNYQEALVLIDNDTTDKALRIKENLYFNLAYNLYKLKDYEAYRFQEKSHEIKDQLRDIEIRRIIEELGFKYDFNTQKKLL